MYRTKTCGELRLADNGVEVTLAGWVQKVRKMGGMTFVDLRDRYGITQLVFNESVNAALCEQANRLGREYCIQAKGVVGERQSKNDKIATGDIEILVSELTVLSPSAVPPFTIEDNTDGGDDLRMKYRYLDLRRNVVRSNLELRHRMTILIRNFLDAQQFIEVETPILIGSTPEGLLVLEALRQRESGLTAEEMVAWAEEARYFVQTLFMVDDLDALHRGGRIPASVAFAGSKLDLKPLLNFDTNGKLSLAGASHGRKKGLKQLASFYEKAHAENSNFALIGHADSEKDADRVCELLAKQDESITVIKHNIGATIGSHVGAGMVSISFWGTDRREALSVADKIARKVRKGE